MKDNKKTIILAVLSVLILVAAAIGITFAYFSKQINTEGKVEVDTETTSQTNVTYRPGADINLINAEPGAIDESEFSLVLDASNKTADTITYGIIWDVTENNFDYVYEHREDPQLTYDLYYRISPTDSWIPYITDADCTTYLGNIKIADGLTLTADVNMTSTIYWKFVLRYKAYDYNQANNMEKTLKGKILLDSKDI